MSDKSLLPRITFDRVLALPDVDWTKVSDAKVLQVTDRLIELYQELHLITAIEGVKKFAGAKYLYEEALTKVMTTLGVEISTEERDDLLISGFIE